MDGSTLRRIGTDLLVLAKDAFALCFPLAKAGVRTLALSAAERPMRFLACLLLAVSFLFMAVPGLDLAVSGWFAAPAGGFPLARDETLRLVRDANRLLPTLLLTSLVAALVVHALRPGTGWILRPHQALFVLSVYGLGGGVIVHSLKNIVGRARPEHVAEFGGPDRFSVAWQMSNACSDNCSFSSGEAASAVAMLAFVVILPRAWRRPAVIALLPIVAIFSFNRIAFGSHFLSDVLISWIILSMVMIGLWRVFGRRAEAIDSAVIGCGIPLVSAIRRMISPDRPRAPLPPQ